MKWLENVAGLFSKKAENKDLDQKGIEYEI